MSQLTDPAAGYIDSHCVFFPFFYSVEIFKKKDGEK